MLFKFEKKAWKYLHQAAKFGDVKIAMYSDGAMVDIVHTAIKEAEECMTGDNLSGVYEDTELILTNDLTIIEALDLLKHRFANSEVVKYLTEKQRLNSVYGMFAQSHLDPDKNSPFEDTDSLDVQTPTPDKLSAYPKIRFKKAEVQPLCGFCVCPSCGETVQYNLHINPMYCSDCGTRFDVGDATHISQKHLYGTIFKECECPACGIHNWLRDINKVNYCWQCGKAWVPHSPCEMPVLETEPYIYYHSGCKMYSYAAEKERIYCQHCGEQLSELECKDPQEIKVRVNPAACPQCGHVNYFFANGSYHCTHCGAYIHYSKDGVECV